MTDPTQWKAEYDAAAYAGLRAVADELLEALKIANGIIYEMSDGYPVSSDDARFDVIRAAIAKAKGGAE